MAPKKTRKPARSPQAADQPLDVIHVNTDTPEQAQAEQEKKDRIAGRVASKSIGKRAEDYRDGFASHGAYQQSVEESYKKGSNQVREIMRLDGAKARRHGTTMSRLTTGPQGDAVAFKYNTARGGSSGDYQSDMAEIAHQKARLKQGKK
jgi:hypothetical protein